MSSWAPSTTPRSHRVADAILSEDDAGRPVVLRVGAPLHPANQRLMDSLGVQVVVVSDSVVGARSMGDFIVDGVTEPFEPNLIDFRHSVVLAHKRAAADDETLEICPHCMCEVDVDPQPHRPGCAGIGKSRTTTEPVLAREDWPAQQKKDAKAAAEAGVRLSLGEEAAVGQAAGSSAATSEGELERVASSPSARRPGPAPKWTREKIIEAIQAWAAEHDGKPPTLRNWYAASDEYPSEHHVKRVFAAAWADAIEAAGFEKPTRGTRRSTVRVPRPQPEVEEPEEATSEEREPVSVGAGRSRSSDAEPVEEGQPEKRMSEPPAAAEDGGRHDVPGGLPEPLFAPRLIARLLRVHAETLHSIARYSGSSDRLHDVQASLQAVADFLDEAS